MSPRPGGDVTNSSEFAVMGSGEWRAERVRRESARAAAWRFLKERPGLALLLIYLAVSVVARFDDVWFYRLFQINIFYYSDPEDILLAPLRNTAVWIFFLAPALILLLLSWIGNRKTAEAAVDAPGRGLLDRKWNTPALRFAFAAIVVVTSAAAMARVHAERRSDDVRAGVGRIVNLTRTDGVSYGEDPLLLGSGGNFFFLYYPKRRKTEIVPMENTALMTIDLPQRTESTARIKVRKNGDS